MESRQAAEDATKEQLRQERTAHRVTRAGAEQARRNAECVRAALDALLLHLDQPLAVVDRNGTVTQWNDGMAALCGIASGQAIGETLPGLFRLPPEHPLARALCALDPAATYQPAFVTPRVLGGPIPLRPGVVVPRINLIPFCLVPGTLQAVVVLIGSSV